MKKETVAKFYQKYRLYIFPAIVALSSLFLIVFAIYPQTVKMITSQQTAGNLMNKSKFLDAKVSALESYNEEDLTRKVKLSLASLPAEKDFGNVIELLQHLVGQAGFSVAGITLGSSANKLANSESFEIRLEIKGNKALLPFLLDSLEKSPRLMRISNIDASSNQNSGTLDAALGMEVLYSGLPQSFGSIDSPLPEFNQEDEELIVTLARSVGSISPSSTVSAGPRGREDPFK